MVLFGSWRSHEELTSYKRHCIVVLGAKSSSNTVLKSNFHCHRASDLLHTSIVFGCKTACCCESSDKKHCTDTIDKCGHGYNSTSAESHIITWLLELNPLDLGQLAIQLKTGLLMSQTKSATAHPAKHDL